jgi:cyclase
LRDPSLLEQCAREFGVQAVVLSCDAKGGRATIRGGREVTDVDAVAWCRRAEQLGAGEILLTSVDRDGTNSGFDLELLRAVTSSVKIGVIASGGAGRVEDFRDAIETGGARAVLAASLFHDRVLTVRDVKQHLAAEGIAVRNAGVPPAEQAASRRHNFTPTNRRRDAARSAGEDAGAPLEEIP